MNKLLIAIILLTSLNAYANIDTEISNEQQQEEIEEKDLGNEDIDSEEMQRVLEDNRMNPIED